MKVSPSGKERSMKIARKLLRSSRKASLRNSILILNKGREKYSPPPHISPTKQAPTGKVKGHTKFVRNLGLGVATHSHHAKRNGHANSEEPANCSGASSSEAGPSNGRRRPSKRKLHHEASSKADEATLNGKKEETDDEDEEEEEEEKQLEAAWINCLMKQYWEVRQQYESKVQTKGAAAFKRACTSELANRKGRHTARRDSLPPPPLHLREFASTKHKELATLRNDHNQVMQRCPSMTMTAITSTPGMQYWTLTEVNVMAEDEYALSHIPFLGDTEDDSDFCADLMRTFPDGIHGTKEGCDEYINDWILYYTVKRMRSHLPELDMRTIFRCVYDQFPNKASVQDLISMYPDLQIRFEPETLDRQEFTNSRGELVANFSASRLLNSYEVLLCHKCFSYDCVMHNATISNGYGKAKRKIPRSVWKEENGEDKRPCSQHCYLKKMEQQQKVHPSRSNDKMEEQPHTKKDLRKQLDLELGTSLTSPSTSMRAKGKAGADGDRSVWSPHEEAIFNLLLTTGEANYCKVARVLAMCCDEGAVKKSCQQVYEYASRTAPLSPRLDMASSPVKHAKKKGDNHRTFRAVKWASTNGKVENNCQYRPCAHEGSCTKEKGCRCLAVGNLCTKYCPCGDECANRFPGCRCAPGNCRTRQCQCYFASWECDPDICKSCNCDKFTRMNSRELEGTGESAGRVCKNISIQRGLQKRLLVAPSQVSGWGCFAYEDIEKNEFVSEYCGEVISQAESERRGKIYDKIKCSYLFGLNDEQVVDATRVGNVIRFANHSRMPNCRAKVIVVNGDHKIGIFANRKIVKGEELFFDYAYNKSQQIAFLSKELPRNHYQI